MDMKQYQDETRYARDCEAPDCPSIPPANGHRFAPQVCSVVEPRICLMDSERNDVHEESKYLAPDTSALGGPGMQSAASSRR